jgi:hypothetical protein
MQSKAKTVEQYLSELPDDRRQAIETVRAVILKNLDKDYEEGMQYGMIGYYVPHHVHPAGYHCDPRQPLPFAALGSQKNYMSLYLMCVYRSTDNVQWFQQAWAKTKSWTWARLVFASKGSKTWPSTSSERQSSACRQRSSSSTARRQFQR